MNLGLDCTFEKMDEVRERQERLAKLHFELDGQHDAKVYVIIIIVFTAWHFICDMHSGKFELTLA